jgi:hypothetical protein
LSHLNSAIELWGADGKHRVVVGEWVVDDSRFLEGMTNRKARTRSQV